jgi:hypothetical protein
MKEQGQVSGALALSLPAAAQIEEMGKPRSRQTGANPAPPQSGHGQAERQQQAYSGREIAEQVGGRDPAAGAAVVSDQEQTFQRRQGENEIDDPPANEQFAQGRIPAAAMRSAFTRLAGP